MLHFPKMLTYKYNSEKQLITRHFKLTTVQALFVNVIYGDQVLYAPKNEVLFVRIKLFLSGNESFSNSTFYGAIVSNTQYSTSGGLIYSDNTNFYCIP